MFLSVSVAMVALFSRRASAAVHSLGVRLVSEFFFLVAKAVVPVVLLKIIQALFDLGIIFGSIPFLAHIESRDVSKVAASAAPRLK